MADQRLLTKVIIEVQSDMEATVFIAVVLWDYLWHHSRLSRVLSRGKR